MRKPPRVYQRRRRGRTGKLADSATWYADLYVRGRRAERGVPLGTTDEVEARTHATQLQAELEQRAAGLADPIARAAAAPIEQHLAEWEVSLRARRSTGKHVKDRLACVRAFISHLGARSLADLLEPEADSRAVRWLVGGAGVEGLLEGRGPSARAVNKRRAALKQLGRWLHLSRRSSFPPFALLPLQPEEEDRRRVREPLGQDELARLIEAEPSLERRTCYLVAATTGLRRAELAALRWSMLDLDGAAVTLPAAKAKNRRAAALPLHPDAVALLRELHAARTAGTFRRGSGHFAVAPQGAAPGDLVFNGVPTVRAFYRALERIGVKPIRQEGDVTIAKDLHALRGTHATRLEDAGASPDEARRLMRHSTYQLTSAVYQRRGVAALGVTLGRVPSVLRQAVDSTPAESLADPGDAKSAESATLRRRGARSSKPQVARSSRAGDNPPKPATLPTKLLLPACCEMANHAPASPGESVEIQRRGVRAGVRRLLACLSAPSAPRWTSVARRALLASCAPMRHGARRRTS